MSLNKKFNIKNMYAFHDYYARLKSIAMSVFEWVNLPDSCNARFLEDTLYHYGRAIFVNDETMSYLNLKVAPNSTLNVYNETLKYTAFSTGYSKEYDATKCVLIRNNYIEKSTDSTILYYAERIAKIDVAIDVNINAQKTPVLVKCDDKTKLTLENVYRQYDGNKPVIFGQKTLMDNPLEVLKTDAPFVADKLRDEKRALWNECLEFLGVNTNPSDKKKERLIVSEVDSNNEQIDIQADTMLLCRQEACKKINEMFGLNVSVKRRLKNNDSDERGVDLWQNTPLS